MIAAALILLWSHVSEIRMEAIKAAIDQRFLYTDDPVATSFWNSWLFWVWKWVPPALGSAVMAVRYFVFLDVPHHQHPVRWFEFW